MIGSTPKGLWRPQVVRSFRQRAEYLDELDLLIRTYADNPNYRFHTMHYPSPSQITTLYLGKLEYDVTDKLLYYSLAKLGRFGGHVAVHKDVVASILSVTARYLAAESRDLNSRLVPGTDEPVRHQEAFGDLNAPGTRYSCLELLLRGLAPVPGPDTSFADVVDFRERHADEVGAFRVEVDRLLTRVRTSDDPFDAVRSARREIELAVSNLKRSATSRRMSLLGGALTFSLAGTAVSQLPLESIQWAFDGVAVPASAALLGWSLRRPRPRLLPPYSYLLRLEEEYGNP